MDPTGAGNRTPFEKLDALERQRLEAEIVESTANLLSGFSIPMSPDRSWYRTITSASVAIEGEFPDTRLVTIFTSDVAPGQRYGLTIRLWDEPLARALDRTAYFVSMIVLSLVEEFVAATKDFPVDEAGDVVWIRD